MDSSLGHPRSSAALMRQDSLLEGVLGQILPQHEQALAWMLQSADPGYRMYLLTQHHHSRWRVYQALLFCGDWVFNVHCQGEKVKEVLLDILKVSSELYHEAILIFLRQVRYRKVIFNEYDISALEVFRRPAGEPHCCLFTPCPLLPRLDISEFVLHSVVFFFGSPDLATAVRRRWAFADFMTTLRIRPLKITSLILVAGPNWKIPGFTVKDIAKSTFEGAVEILGDVKLEGFSAEDAIELCAIMDDRNIKHQELDP